MSKFVATNFGVDRTRVCYSYRDKKIDLLSDLRWDPYFPLSVLIT